MAACRDLEDNLQTAYSYAVIGWVTVLPHAALCFECCVFCVFFFTPCLVDITEVPLGIRILTILITWGSLLLTGRLV